MHIVLCLTVIEHIIWKFWFWFDLMFNKVIFWSDLWMIRLLCFFGAVWFNFSLDQHSLWTVIASKFFYTPHIICTGECCRCCNQIFFMQRKNSRSWISMAFYIYNSLASLFIIQQALMKIEYLVFCRLSMRYLSCSWIRFNNFLISYWYVLLVFFILLIY